MKKYEYMREMDLHKVFDDLFVMQQLELKQPVLRDVLAIDDVRDLADEASIKK